MMTSDEMIKRLREISEAFEEMELVPNLDGMEPYKGPPPLKSPPIIRPSSKPRTKIAPNPNPKPKLRQ